MLKSLLDIISELKAAGIDGEALESAAVKTSGGLQKKLLDLSALYSAYDAILSRGLSDPSSRLENLAEKIGVVGVGNGGHIYVDGFTDFTALEFDVIGSLMKKDVEITVCLTCSRLDEENEVFEISRKTALRLLAMARSLGIDHEISDTGESRRNSGAMDFIEKNLFSYTAERFEDAGDRVRLCSARGIMAECELAAARAMELVMQGDCRFRDIAVAVRGFEEYRPAIQSAFEHYGVPLYQSRKSNIMAKPSRPLFPPYLK